MKNIKKQQDGRFLNFFGYGFSEKLPFEALYRISIGQNIDKELAQEAFKSILSIKKDSIRTALMSMMLNGVMAKGARGYEIVGLMNAALSLDGHLEKDKIKAKVPVGKKIIGYTGSGKKGIKTINISTPSAILAASVGVYVAKGCSSSTSSVTGSMDFLNIIGLDIVNNHKTGKYLLEKEGIGFFSMEKTTPKFAKVYAGRFFSPHALSVALAGITLPVETDTMLYGLAHPDISLSAEVFKSFGFNNVMITSSTEDGIHYIDEVGVSGTLSIIGIKNGVLGRVARCLPAKELKLDNYFMEDLKTADNPIQNAKLALLALAGKGEKAHMDAICANAGMLIYMAGLENNFYDSYKLAKKNLVNGKGLEKLKSIMVSAGVSNNKLKKIYE